MNPPEVGIVILTYNSENYIENCLKSLLKNTYSHFTCIVIDNKSTDRTVNIVHKKFPKIKLVENKANKGYAAGNNIGIRYFQKKKNVSYILILNPDTLVDKNLILELVNFMKATPDAGITGPTITYANNPRKIWFAGGYLNKLFLYTKHLYMNKKIDEFKTSSSVIARIPTKSGDEAVSRKKRLPRSFKVARNDMIKTDFITGACMIIKKEVFKKVGLLPEDYFMYFEDVDFCQNIYKKGYNCYVLSDPLVKHHISSSAGKPGSNDLTPLRAYYFARNPFIYIKKNVTGFYKITNYIGQFIIRLPYYGIQILIQGNLKNIASYIRGMKDGVLY